MCRGLEGSFYWGQYIERGTIGTMGGCGVTRWGKSAEIATDVNVLIGLVIQMIAILKIDFTMVVGCGILNMTRLDRRNYG